MKIDIVGFALFGEVFFAKGFEVEFAGVLYDGSFFVVDFDGEHAFLYLIFFGGVEVEGAKRPDGFFTGGTAFGIGTGAVVHDAAFGEELLRSDEFVNRPLDVAFEFRIYDFVFKFSESRRFPGFKFNIFHTREFLVPHVDLTDELVDTSAFHAEIGMWRRPFDFCAVGLWDTLRGVFLIANIINDGIDVAVIEKGLVGKELNNGFPEVFVFEFFTQRATGELPCVSPVVFIKGSILRST